MRQTVWRAWRVRAAALFAGGALVLAAATLQWAVRAVELPPSATLASPIASRDASRDAVPPSLVAPSHVVALDPFAEQRGIAPVREEVPAAPPLALLGTIAGAEPPSAVCQLGRAAPRILHPGDTLGGWRLQQVWPGRALFIDADGARRELRLSPLGH
jgi:hypothetical protein